MDQRRAHQKWSQQLRRRSKGYQVDGVALLIQVARLTIQVSAASGKQDAKFKFKGSFAYSGISYLMTLTDPVAIDYVGHKGVGKYAFEDVYLTVSLTEPFNWDNRCHKLIAAVMRKPAA